MSPHISKQKKTACLDYKERHYINQLLLVDNVRVIEKINEQLTEAYREGVLEGLRQSVAEVDKISDTAAFKQAKFRAINSTLCPTEDKANDK